MPRGKPRKSGALPTRHSSRNGKQLIDKETLARYLFEGHRASGLLKQSDTGGGAQVAAPALVEEVEVVEVDVEVIDSYANDPVLPDTLVRATASHHTHTCHR